MNQKTEPDVTKNEIIDFPTTITIICHLMTLYAQHPCEPLATNISRHIKAILNSSASDSLGEWKDTFKQLLPQWERIADQHLQSEKNKHHTATH